MIKVNVNAMSCVKNGIKSEPGNVTLSVPLQSADQNWSGDVSVTFQNKSHLEYQLKPLVPVVTDCLIPGCLISLAASGPGMATMKVTTCTVNLGGKRPLWPITFTDLVKTSIKRLTVVPRIWR